MMEPSLQKITPFLWFDGQAAVSCESQAELDEMCRRLTSDGGKEIQCGWPKDKYGLSWQIVPAMMQALMGMVKLDIAKLQTAYDNG